MQQRSKNDVPRQPSKVHWDHLLDEADWLRRDFREERMWKMEEAKKRAVECLEGWRVVVKERGRCAENVKVTSSDIGCRYKRKSCNELIEWAGTLAVRTLVSDEHDGDGVLEKCI